MLFKSLDLFCLTFRAVVAYIVSGNLISIYDNQYRADIFPLIPLDIKKSSLFSFNQTDFFDFFKISKSSVIKHNEKKPDVDKSYPAVTYINAESLKKSAIKDNEGKAGVYRWTHLDTNKSYVGSSVNLGRRFRSYFNCSFITHITRNNMVINKALIKYGYSKFKLEILEYCDPKVNSKREQYYMDYLKPEYNVLKVAYSSLGYKHSEEALVKIKKNLTNLNSNKVIKVKVTNLQTNISHVYPSITDTAKKLNTSKSTITKYIKNSMPTFKNTYKLEANLPISNYDSNYINHPNAIKIEVTDLELKTITNYSSIHAVSRALKIGHNSIANYFKRNQMRPYKGRYILKKI